MTRPRSHATPQSRTPSATRTPGGRVAFVGGGGTLGSSAAFWLAARGVVAEAVLIDAREHMAKSHAMDLEQAVAGLGDTVVRAGTWDDLRGSDVVVLSAGIPERSVASRDEYLAGNVAIVREAAAQVADRCPHTVMLTATNPVDVFNTVLPRLTGMEPRRFVGYSYNDTLRLRWAVARILGEPVRDVDALVLGEHGEAQVPLFDRTTVRSQPVRLTAEQEQEAESAIRKWFSTYQALQSGRTSGWTSAVGIGLVVEAIVTGTGPVLPCSAHLHGQYGLSGISLGMPVKLGFEGIEEVLEMPLTPAQRERFEAAARKVRGLAEDVLARV